MPTFRAVVLMPELVTVTARDAQHARERIGQRNRAPLRLDGYTYLPHVIMVTAAEAEHDPPLGPGPAAA